MVNKHGKPTAFAAHQHVLPRANPKTHSRNGFFASCTRGNGAGYASDSLGAVQGLSFSGIGRPDRFTDARAFSLAWSVRASEHSTLVSVCDGKWPAEIVPKSVCNCNNLLFFFFVLRKRRFCRNTHTHTHNNMAHPHTLLLFFALSRIMNCCAHYDEAISKFQINT